MERCEPARALSVLGTEQGAMVDFFWHEVNRPIAALSLCIQTALRRSRSLHGPAEVNDRLVAAEWQCQTLARLLTRLRTVLDPAAQAPLSPEPADLGVLVSHITNVMKDQFEAWGVHLVVDAEPIPGRWDRVAITGVLENLLANAAVHGGGAPVTVRLRAALGWALLEVHDDGPGIGAEEQERIFELGARGEHATGAGLGLGLSIVRQLARAQGGEVDLHSGPGTGTSFVVRLPIFDDVRAPEDISSCRHQL